MRTVQVLRMMLLTGRIRNFYFPIRRSISKKPI